MVAEPADGSDAMSGAPSVRPMPVRVGSRGSAGTARSVPSDLPTAPARMSFGARPAFMTIERENPDAAVRVSIWAT